MDIQLIYITASNMAEAKSIGRLLLENRLVACINLVDNMQAMYWWEGSIQEGHEVVIIAKTTADRVASVIETVTKAHSYECPCVVSLPISNGNPSFLNWIKAEVQIEI